MRVSIITVSLNSIKHIAKTIESVLSQSYGDIEYIIIDGGSTDGTLDIIRKFEPLFNGRMRWISEKDNGIYDAMNKGIKMANGELIGIINSDDWYSQNAVEILVSEYNKSPDIGVFYGNMYLVDKDGKIVLLAKPTKDLTNYSCYDWMPFGHPTAFVRKTVYDSIGAFNTKYKIAADHEFVMRCSSKSIKFKYIDEIIANFREGGACDNHNEGLRESTLIKIDYGAIAGKAWRMYKIAVLKANLFKLGKRIKILLYIYEFYRKNGKR